MATDYQGIFKKIYYHLYTNSNSSRAEKLLDDVTKLLLYSFAVSKGDVDGISFSGQEILLYLENKYSGTEYSPSPFALDDSTISSILPELLTLDLRNAPAHVIGEAVQSMIGPRIRGDKGQFFTPESLVRCIVSIVGVNSGEIVVDPACGTGGFLSAAHANTAIDGEPATYVGADKDRDMANLAFAVMEVEASGHSSVNCCNSLEYYKDGNPLHPLINRADVIMTNPPFGAKIGVTDQEVLSHFEFGHSWVFSRKDNRWHRSDALVRKQDPQVLFIELCVKLLRDGGRLGIVLPEGVFYSKAQGYIWQYLKDNGRIVALIDCPRNTFQPSTDTKTNVLVFEKGQKTNGGEVWFAQARTCGHDRRGRTVTMRGEAIPDDFAAIALSWNEREESPYWVTDVLEENLYIPRYYVNRAPHDEGANTITLGEMIDVGCLGIRSGHEVGSDAYGSGSIPYVRTSDIDNFEVSADPTNSVSEEVYERFRNQEDLKSGDILFVADGRYRIGKTAMITEHNAKCVVQSHIDILTLSSDAPVSPFELLYLLNTQDVQSQISNLVFISSTLGTIGNRIREIRIPLPERNEEWKKTIQKFQSLITQRAAMLYELKRYEKDSEDY